MVEGGRRGLMPLATPTENTRGEGTRRNTFAYSDRGSDYTHTTYQYSDRGSDYTHTTYQYSDRGSDYTHTTYQYLSNTLYTVKRTILAALYNSFFCFNFRIEWVR